MTINHIGISGGKDSTALLLWAVHESGYPKESIFATFTDTGNEGAETYAQVAMLSERVHHIETIRAEMDFYELAAHKSRFPSAKARFCTQYLKMDPTRTYIRAMQQMGLSVRNHSGVRRGESEARAHLTEYETAEESYFGCEGRRPLLDWTLEDVWAIHARYDIPTHPYYALGMQRVGCLPCIMSRKEEIAQIARLFPERFDTIRAAEAEGAASARGGRTFFSPNKVPMRYRSGKWEDKKRGRWHQLAMVDDVVRWATADGGYKTLPLDFDDNSEHVLTCVDKGGFCE